MSPGSSRSIKIAVAVALVGVAAYWHWSPVLALGQMKSAAKALDGAAFNAYVDYPRLRESMNHEIMAKVAGVAPGADKPAGAAGMLGQIFVASMIEALVRPETVMRMMKEGAVQPEAGEPDTKEEDKTDWSSQREGLDTFVAYVGDKDEPQEKRLGLVMERSGFASWRLVGMRMPGPLN